ncbi:MAG: maleylpyruvate isomerase N-terminal domain-containing protein [Ilumatobacteraceae bacterium]
MGVVDRHVEGAATAHQRLLAMLQPVGGPGLTDEMVRRPSLLPEWTVGHVLAHLVHNAESFVRLFAAAESGETVDQYPGGSEGRARDIAADAGLAATEHCERLRRSIYALEASWAGAQRAWEGHGRTLTSVLVPITEIPLRRWREVEVHTGDLGLVELGDRRSEIDPRGIDLWSEDYIRHDVVVLTMQYKARRPMGLTDLPDAVRVASPRYRLAWLLGRYDFDGLPSPSF